MTVLGDLDDFIEVCGLQAELYDRGLIDLHVAVDTLQRLAECWGLPEVHGQDTIQAIIAFAPAPHDEASVNSPPLSDFDRREMERRIECWEAADRNPVPVATEPARYRTPQSVIDAFWCVLRQGDADRLSLWLADHSRDASYLNEIWRAKCSTAAA
ncbi:hypothetical protein [Bradyrhizobium sp. dw_78]|uniref:hypothetical protein n=1 Tax=Bradyrhizobium sp. dw_78 TaxID=2719793 RepID=UPI001BD4B8E9|nr:hypothetical protein [Bradyrhizobium sp. dw_78]